MLSFDVERTRDRLFPRSNHINVRFWLGMQIADQRTSQCKILFFFKNKNKLHIIFQQLALFTASYYYYCAVYCSQLNLNDKKVAEKKRQKRKKSKKSRKKVSSKGRDIKNAQNYQYNDFNNLSFVGAIDLNGHQQKKQQKMGIHRIATACQSASKISWKLNQNAKFYFLSTYCVWGISGRQNKGKTFLSQFFPALAW